MKSAPPVIPPDLVPFLESGVSILVGTRDEHLRPDGVRGVGVRVEADGREVTVFLAEPPAAGCLGNLAANGRVAVAFSRPVDHRSVQLKGQVVGMRAAGKADREAIDRYRGLLIAALGEVGLSPRLVGRIRMAPCRAVRFRVEAVYEQTPGPGAGEPLRDAAAGDAA